MTRQRCGRKWPADTPEVTAWHTCVRPPGHPGKPELCKCACGQYAGPAGDPA